MVNVSRGYVSSPADAQLAKEEFRLFVQHLDLIVSHEVEILGNKDLFWLSPAAHGCMSPETGRFFWAICFWAGRTAYSLLFVVRHLPELHGRTQSSGLGA